MVTQKPSSTHAPPSPPSRAPSLRRAADRLALRPMARVQRITLFEREIRERLSRAALDVVFARADVLSEGQRTTRAGAAEYVGSTMLTIDLGQLSAVLRDACDAATARRLARLIEGDPVVAGRVKSLAAVEMARVAGVRPRAINTEFKVEARGVRVFIDVDVEAAL
jgi:hypothetical protein